MEWIILLLLINIFFDVLTVKELVKQDKKTYSGVTFKERALELGLFGHLALLTIGFACYWVVKYEESK